MPPLVLLSSAGLETKMFYSVQKDEVLVKIRASPERLRQEAARIGYKVGHCKSLSLNIVDIRRC